MVFEYIKSTNRFLHIEHHRKTMQPGGCTGALPADLLESWRLVEKLSVFAIAQYPI